MAPTLRSARRGALESLRRRRPPVVGTLGRGVVLMGRVWPGGAAPAFDGVVIVDGRGVIDYIGPGSADTVPPQLPIIGDERSWVGPGIVDAHVHLAFGSLDQCLRSGLVGVRDLGAPMAAAQSWRTGHRSPTGERPIVAVSGPILTAPGGYPSRSWGRAGFAAFIASAGHARQVVQRIAADGADVIKLALEPGDHGWPVLSPAMVRAIVGAAHDAGLAVVAHALSAELVRRALDAGVDELAHTPTEPLPEELVDRIAAKGVSVVSTLQTFFATGAGRASAANASALYRAGVVLRYGTDLGNAGTWPGVDPRELDRLADTGLGRRGALQAATQASANAPGIRARTGLVQLGRPGALVVLSGDPLDEPGVWRVPKAVVADGRLLVNEHS
jgi:imidazolonepropionase-like amidohydrolase